jgi:hypothetical protein
VEKYYLYYVHFFVFVFSKLFCVCETAWSIKPQMVQHNTHCKHVCVTIECKDTQWSHSTTIVLKAVFQPTPNRGFTVIILKCVWLHCVYIHKERFQKFITHKIWIWTSVLTSTYHTHLRKNNMNVATVYSILIIVPYFLDVYATINP